MKLNALNLLPQFAAIYSLKILISYTELKLPKNSNGNGKVKYF